MTYKPDDETVAYLTIIARGIKPHLRETFERLLWGEPASNFVDEARKRGMEVTEWKPPKDFGPSFAYSVDSLTPDMISSAWRDIKYLFT